MRKGDFKTKSQNAVKKYPSCNLTEGPDLRESAKDKEQTRLDRQHPSGEFSGLGYNIGGTASFCSRRLSGFSPVVVIERGKRLPVCAAHLSHRVKATVQ